ncbi:MAG TPA: M56 family metallopeptidase [Gemmatimonadales bacterium]|jgi:HEAT repeat protein
MTLLQLSPDIPQALLATLALRATAVLAAAWLLTMAMRRAAASTRHAVWTAALGVLVLLPVASFLIPRWQLDRTDSRQQAVAPSPIAATAQSMAPATSSTAALEPARQDPFTYDVAVPPRSPMSVSLLVIVWGLGAAFGLGRLSAGLAAARRLVRRATPMPGSAGDAVGRLAQGLGIRRHVRALMAEGITVPVNCGLFRPVVLLPASAQGWTDERLHVVLLHELAHVRRWDYAALLAMEAARALYWVNPLVWIAARHANIELERACDDEVIRAGTRSVDYAEHLYAIAASLAGGRTPTGALAMAQPSTLRARVGAILSASMNRSPVRLRAIGAAGAAALFVGVPLASMRLLGEGRDAAVEDCAITVLSLKDASLREHAAFTLGTLKAVSARGSLTSALKDADPGVRGMAAWALGNLNTRAAEPALVGALSDADADVREMAVEALASLGDRAAVPALARLTADPTMGVRGVLTNALHRLGGPEAAAALTTMVLHDGDPHVRDMATYALRLSAGRDAVPTLITVLRDPSPDIRVDAASNLADLADPRAFDALALALQSDSVGQVRSSAAWALGQLKDARAAVPLAAAMADSDWHPRVAIVNALGMTPGARAEDALIAATRDPVHQVRLSAIAALNAHAHS